MSTTPPATDARRRTLVRLLGLAGFAIILLMPQPEGMSPEAQRLLAVVVLMAVWWMGNAIAMAATALLPLVLFPLLDIMPSSVVAPNYANHLIFLFLGGFMIALAMEKWNLHKRIALTIINAIGARPERVVLGFMVASAFLSMWISNTATTMMMLPVAIAVVQQIAANASLAGVKDGQTQLKIERGLGLVLMLGLAYSASIGGVATLVGTPTNIVFAGAYQELFPDRTPISFAAWMLLALPLVVLFLPLVWFYLCRLASPIPLRDIECGEQQTNAVRSELEALGQPSREERIIFAAFVLTAFLWTFRSPIQIGDAAIPGWSQLLSQPEYVHDATVAMLVGLALMLIPARKVPGEEDEHGSALLDWRTVQAKVPWGILFIFGGGFALASGFNATGLDQWIGAQLSGASALPLVFFVLLICLSVTFLTELTSNTATTSMLMPILAAVAVAAAYPPAMLMVPAAMSASFAFMLPVATPPNAIVYGSGWVTIGAMSRIGLALNLLGAVVICGLIMLTMDYVASW